MEHNRNPDIEEEAYLAIEKQINELFDEWVLTVTTADVYIATGYGYDRAFSEDTDYDLSLIFAAIFFVVIYLFLFLGTFSPMFCRCWLAIVGLLCIGLSYTAGFGFMYIVGGKTGGVHQLMPFLLIGIGADDLFVMCGAIDQTDYKDSTKDRLRHAIGHAGPAITITSLTNALAFAFGATGSLEALSSFCLFASMSIVMLYFTVLCLFLPVLVWDTRRVEKKTKECCGLCCCPETTPLCCCGKCLSFEQMDYCEIPIPQETLDKIAEEEKTADLALKTVLRGSGTEKCLGKYFAPFILNKWSRLVWLAIYLIWSAIAVYGIT